jgi:hypothetical protein
MSLLYGASLLVSGSLAAPAADLVNQIPGYTMPSFKVYSGYLTVPGPLGGREAYDSLKIHYQFHESSGTPATSPVVTWHQGGPGGSSLYGAYTEMGHFGLDTNGTYINPYAWNSVANMLYLESPAGSDDPIGFSYCTKNGGISDVCKWDDKTQAEAYAHTLLAFYKAFPAYAKNDLYLSGESYAGQYLPNIAYFITEQMPSQFTNLKGILVGNGCWGGTATETQCNGPNSEQNDLDMYFGKGLVSKRTYNLAYSSCKFPKTNGLACQAVLADAFNEVGPHNVYDIYDNCPQTAEWLKRSGKSMRWLINNLRSKMGSRHTNSSAGLHDDLIELGGGYDWQCGGMSAMANFFQREDVQKALNLGKPSLSRFDYDSSGPASVTLYPTLVKKMRVLIYNGDSDACVPYKGNEEWTEGLADQGVIKQNKPWHPWFADGVPQMPAGYSTTYTVPGAPYDFSFVTIRLAGHMVPSFQPLSALTFFKRFLAGTAI